MADRVSADGFAIARGVLGGGEVYALINDLPSGAAHAKQGKSYGVRHVLSASPAIAAMAAEPPLSTLASSVLGPQARPVKAILFDKIPEANWAVPWHQDLTIAVREKREVCGYGPWTLKDGAHHVQPPEEILKSIIALRIHLDPCPSDNGALRILRGTHAFGKVPSQEIAKLASEYEECVCQCGPGDVLLMRPLAIHSSRPAERPARRRVLHIEYAARDLDGGLAWLD